MPPGGKSIDSLAPAYRIKARGWNMSDQYLAEIRIFGFNFAPKGWATCSGQIVSIAQNTALFSLLGTTYGGNGQTTFALPDLRGRTPIHWGTGAGLPTVSQGQ